RRHRPAGGGTRLTGLADRGGRPAAAGGGPGLAPAAGAGRGDLGRGLSALAARGYFAASPDRSAHALPGPHRPALRHNHRRRGRRGERPCGRHTRARRPGRPRLSRSAGGRRGAARVPERRAPPDAGISPVCVRVGGVMVTNPRPQAAPDALTPTLALGGALLLLVGAALGALLAAVVALPALPALASSLLGSSPKAYWYLARAAGFVAYLLIWLSVVVGLLITGKLARLWP